MNTSLHQALAGGTVWCPLDHSGLIGFAGEDAQTFLQGQLTNDTKLISDQQSQIAGYCTAKGRLLATLLLWKTKEGYAAQLHAGIAEAVRKRLGMYVLRSKVKVQDVASGWTRIGLAGAGAAGRVSGMFGSVPLAPMETVRKGDALAIRLHGEVPRFEIVLPRDEAADHLRTLQDGAITGTAEFWSWLAISSGIPEVCPETQEQFVPQMLNLDLLGGISLNKGCYTGQEIVARTHYLGKVKRRTYLAHVDAELPSPGQALYGVDSAEPVGLVVNVASAPEGGFDLLAELRSESVEAGAVTLGAKDGPVLTRKPLPYDL